MDENDSFDENAQFATVRECVRAGKAMGATHVLLCYEMGDPPDEERPVFVMPGQCVDTMVERCQGGCAGVSAIDLSEVRDVD